MNKFLMDKYVCSGFNIVLVQMCVSCFRVWFFIVHWTKLKKIMKSECSWLVNKILLLLLKHQRLYFEIKFTSAFSQN